MRSPKVRKDLSRQVYISTKQIAELLGWRVERTREWLAREGALEKKGRHYFTTLSRLRNAFPEIVERIDLGGLETE